MATVGLGMLAWRATGNHTPGPTALWNRVRDMGGYCVLFALYVVTLWTDLAVLRARAFSFGLLAD